MRTHEANNPAISPAKEVPGTAPALPAKPARKRQPVREQLVIRWTERIALCVANGVPPVQLGLALLKAKPRLGLRWQEALKAGRFGLDRITTLTLLRIAANKVLTNPQHWHALPTSLRPLSALAELDPATVEKGIQDGTICQGMTDEAAEEFGARHIYSKAPQSAKLTAALAGNISAARLAKHIMEDLRNWPHGERKRAVKLLRALADQLQGGMDPHLISQIL